MQIFRVGGCVRDWLMGHEPKDIDYVVVGTTPEDMLAKGFQQVGADFPVFLREDGTEFALARTERKSGRGYNGFETVHTPGALNQKLLEQFIARGFNVGVDYDIKILLETFQRISQSDDSSLL